MSGILPYPQLSARTGGANTPSCEWVMPTRAQKGDYAKMRRALPSGMPDCLEVHIIHSTEGVERSTAVIYGEHAYLVHYEFKPHTEV